jgi:5,10-methylenetetrahydrofolate reductase
MQNTQLPFPELLQKTPRLVSVELRPPRTARSGLESMDDWIDTYHTIRRLTLSGTHVFITDNAVGQLEEENLRHLVANLGPDAIRSHIIPFLTCKHTLDYCLRYAERAFEHGFPTLVVLGGDRHDGVPRCVEHARELRQQIRRRVPGLVLGGWANPHANPVRQVEYLLRGRESADFFLTQVVSHHHASAVTAFIEELRRRKVDIPGLFGVFYYRSARRSTLDGLGQFFPVPAAELVEEFERERLDAEGICARSMRGLNRLGVHHLYISNLPVGDAPARLTRLLQAVEADSEKESASGCV